MTPSGQPNHVAPLRLFIIPRTSSVTDSVRWDRASTVEDAAPASFPWTLTKTLHGGGLESDTCVRPAATNVAANGTSDLILRFKNSRFSGADQLAERPVERGLVLETH